MANQETLGLFVDVKTNKTVERALTDDEKQVMTDRATRYEAQIKEAAAKAKARKSALAKLAALGLTEQEIAAL
jgi:hypothetical protein